MQNYPNIAKIKNSLHYRYLSKGNLVDNANHQSRYRMRTNSEVYIN